MRKSLLVTALLLSACNPSDPAVDPAASEPSSATTSREETGNPPGDPATVVRVFDGDSMLVSLNGDDVEVRMLGINAPEGDECHGDEARDTLRQLVANNPVTLVTGGEDTDQFDRLLRYVYSDGLNLNLALVANGDAVALQSGHEMEDEFVAVGDESYASGLGMWAGDACGADGEYEVEIVDYVYDPSGRDTDNINGEWIAIANTGSDSIDIGSWKLRDESSRHRFVFPQGAMIEPGDELFVYSGCGSDTPSEFYWCAGDPVWSNGGDTVILQDSAGSVVDRDRFPGDF